MTSAAEAQAIPAGGCVIPAHPLALTAERKLDERRQTALSRYYIDGGCVPGIHEILRRQGLLAGRWCLDPHEDLSDRQMAEIDRVCAAYPHLADDDFVAANLDRWLR